MSLVTVGAELLSAKEKLQSFKNNVTVFGSARVTIEGSFITTPFPFIHIRVLAVPRSIAISPEIQLTKLRNKPKLMIFQTK